jgi:succinylglutamic semialdehyde dehydrogenase
MPENPQFESINPSDGSIVWQGAAAARQDVQKAVTAARQALPAWSACGFEERKQLVLRFAEILREAKDEMATLIAREIGKPLWEAKTELAAMVGKTGISIDAHEKRCAEFPGGQAITRFRPHGVLAVLGPYNFPGHLPNGHICPALLAGNTVIFKPSELAPATGARLVDYWNEAGLPSGVLQILQGAATTAIELTQRKLAAQMAATPGKMLALEMGGNNPLIVDSGNIAHLEAAAEITLRSAFLSAGQRCTCARRLVLVDSPKAQSFLDRLIALTAAIPVDDPFAEPQPFMGPLASIRFPKQVLAAQKELLGAGGKILLEAKPMREGTGFISPGIIDVTELESRSDDEIFGPVLQLIRVPDMEHAITEANNTRFGLAAGLLTDKEEVYQLALPRLRAGIINWNVQLTGASSAAPFGGIKDSGNLRPSAYFAADYCSYPVASMESNACAEQPDMPGRPG